MSQNTLDYLILGPAHPFRGGIAETQHQFAKALQKQGKKVGLVTFTKLYPKLLFPGKTQLSTEEAPEDLSIYRAIHAYHPLQWAEAVRFIHSQDPAVVVFRYYTPFLSFVYHWIGKRLSKKIKKIALVDNWIPHEPRGIDQRLNRLFTKSMDAFTCLSPGVAEQIKTDFKGPLWEGFHPINENLLPGLNQKKAKTKLNWETETTYVLFFGLIRKYKGLELLIEAFSQKPLFNKNVKLYVAGECYEDPQKYIQLIDSLGLTDRIILDFNYKTKTEIQELFSASDIVAQTYHTATQSGVTPIAYHYQKPLLVSNIDGLRDPILKDQSGVVVEKNNLAIAEGIVSLLEKKQWEAFVEQIKKSSPQYRWSSFVTQWNAFVSETKIKSS